MLTRKLAGELLGTFALVFVGVGAATLSFGFKLDGGSTSAGVVTTSLAFGLVLLALVYAIGPVSGCHVNPAVTIGFVVSKRMRISEALGYWGAQFVGAIAGAAALWAVFSGAHGYSRSVQGLGTNGWGSHSIIGLNAGGAFAAEAILTAVFVLVVLSATSHVASAGFAGLAIGMGLGVANLAGIPLTGASINPARSLGPAVIVGGDALSQLWLFIVAPLLGGILAALIWLVLIAERPDEPAAGQVAASDLAT
ncbi:MAG: aquaporin [Solirubrobacteraceae bacterium]